MRLQNYLTKTNTSDDRHLPLLNSLFTERFSVFNPYTADQNFKTYMKWARRSPHLMGFVNIISTDILSDRMEFNPFEDNVSGKNRVKKAKLFWNLNKGFEVCEETLYDLFLLGIGYNWVGSINENQLKEFCDVIIRESYPSIETKEFEHKSSYMYNYLKKGNTGELAKKLRHIPASTVTMHSDQYEILKYIQRVGVNHKEFDAKEVIPFKLMPLDGKVYPFAPMESLLAEVYLLWIISQNYVSYFDNGGTPDNVFVLPKEIAGSKNHEYLINVLRKYKKVQNKHGNLVFTGDISIEKLMDAQEQMQYKDLSLYIVSVLAMFYGVPVSRIPFLVGKAATGGDAGGLADSGYWRKISVWQSKIETAYNNQLWIPYFGVEMKFRRGYLQDEVRETQNEMQKTSVAVERITHGLWTNEKGGKYLGIDPEDIKEAQAEKEERDEKMKADMASQMLKPNGEVFPEPEKQKKNEKKKDTQNENKKKAADSGRKP